MKIIKYRNPIIANDWSSKSILPAPLREISMLEPLISRFLQSSSQIENDSVSIQENAEDFVLEIELPGYSKKEVRLEIERDLLRINLSSKDSATSSDQPSKVRQIRLPEGIDSGKYDATLKNGVLTLKLLKKTAAKPLQLKLK